MPQNLRVSTTWGGIHHDCSKMRRSNGSAAIIQHNVRQINQSWPTAPSGKMISFKRTGHGSSVIISRRTKNLDKETEMKGEKKKKRETHFSNFSKPLWIATALVVKSCTRLVRTSSFFKMAERNFTGASRINYAFLRVDLKNTWRWSPFASVILHN